MGWGGYGKEIICVKKNKHSGFVSNMLYICNQNYNIMKVSIKRQTAFRLDSELLEALKNAAKREHRSLNNYVETLLMDFVYTEPNEETKAAIAEARSGIKGTVYDSVDSLMEDLTK